MSKLWFPNRVSDFKLENYETEKNGPGAFDKLFELVRKTKPELLVIDPLSSTHSRNENTDELKQALNQIDRLIDHSGTTVILVHHESTKVLRDRNGKEVEKNPKERVRGHSCLTDWADLHLSLEEVKQKGRESETKVLNLSWGKTRYSRKPYDREISVNFETMEIVPH